MPVPGVTLAISVNRLAPGLKDSSSGPSAPLPLPPSNCPSLVLLPEVPRPSVSLQVLVFG